MSRPKNRQDVVPVWAPNANYPVSADPWSATPTKTAHPGAASVGFTPKAGVPAQAVNRCLNDAYVTDAAAKTFDDAWAAFVGQLQALNFRQPGVSGSFVWATWNPVRNAWYAIETTTNCKASFTAGWTWGSNVITGTDTLHRIASDAAGNMVITTAVNTGAIHEFNAGTSTWTRRTASVFGGGSFLAVAGKVQIVHDPVAGLWWMGGLNTDLSGIVNATSADRVTWTSRSNPASAGLESSLEVAYGGGTLVLIGRMSTGVSHVWTSTNGGVSWTARADISHGFTAGTAESLTYSATEGLFMFTVGNASTTTAKVYTSPDGVTWTLKVSLTSKSFSRVAAMGAMWVAHCSSQEVAFTVDAGATWRSAGNTLDTPAALLASPGQLLALCASTVFPGFVAGSGFATLT